MAMDTTMHIERAISMHTGPWKVGDLAKQTQLSVRTLHYYEEIGLLIPSARTEVGHRLYTEADVVRLQRILSLRQLGLSLDDVRNALESPDYALEPIIDLHLAKLTEQITLQQRLYQRLSAIRTRLSRGEDVPVTEFIKTMGSIKMVDKYLTPEQLQLIASHHEYRRSIHGNDGMQAFKTFVDGLRTQMKAGAEPASDAVQALVDTYMPLDKANTDDVQALGNAIGRMLREQPDLRQRYGLEDELFEYLEQVMAIARPPEK